MAQLLLPLPKMCLSTHICYYYGHNVLPLVLCFEDHTNLITLKILKADQDEQNDQESSTSLRSDFG